ncbi:MAG: hypothetical protein M3Y27_09155 [Acidobacteriota bacterium]|nr:hypothetical protein [Acidobacteriota bacterium]
MNYGTVFLIAEAITIAATLGLLGRLFWLSRGSQQIALIAFLLLDLITNICAIGLGTGSLAYYSFYEWTIPLNAALYVAVTKEMFAPLYRSYPGLAVLSRRVLVMSVLASLTLALISIPATYSKWTRADYHCATFVMMEVQRYILLAVAIFMRIVHLTKHGWPGTMVSA